MICAECGQEEAWGGKSICKTCFNEKRRAALLRKPIICRECGKEFRSSTASVKYCSDECRQLHQPAYGQFKIKSRDKFQCVYCGKSSIEDGVEIALDHVVPYSAGGPTTAGNLVTACRQCNSQKNKYELPDDVKDRILAEVHRRNAEYGIPDGRPVYMPSSR